MSTEREQLELAAKACRIEVWTDCDGELYCAVADCERPWNPLKSDGDCARMEAHLGICIDWCDTMVMACAIMDAGRWLFAQRVETYADHAGDRGAARRAASVAVAAEIGRNMAS